MADIQSTKNQVLELLDEQSDAHPHGFTETEIMQRCPALSLSQLKRAVSEMEREGMIRCVQIDVGEHRITLPDDDIDEVPLGHEIPLNQDQIIQQPGYIGD
jgi:hypothetical protein